MQVHLGEVETRRGRTKDYHHAGVHYQAATKPPSILSFLLIFLTLEDETTMYSQIVRHQSYCDAAPHHRTDTSTRPL